MPSMFLIKFSARALEARSDSKLDVFLLFYGYISSPTMSSKNYVFTSNAEVSSLENYFGLNHN